MDDYVIPVLEAGFYIFEQREYAADGELISEVPWAEEYCDRPPLAVLRAQRT